MAKDKNQVIKKNGEFTKRFDELAMRRILIWHMTRKTPHFGVITIDECRRWIKEVNSFRMLNDEELVSGFSKIDKKYYGKWYFYYEDDKIYTR